MSAIRQLFTGRDNQSHDLGRWSWAGSFLAIAAHTAWLDFKGQPPTVGDLAQALGVVCAAHAVALFTKQQTEPKASP